MSSSGSGPLGLLLMIAPLAAIPVFAIIGVPQFASVSASQTEDDDIDWHESAASSPVPSRESFATERGTEDSFSYGPQSARQPDLDEPRQLKGASARTRRSQAESPRRRLPPPDALDQWEPGGETQANADRFHSGGGRGQPQLTDAAEEDDESEVRLEHGKVSADGFDPELLMPGKARPDSPRKKRTSAAEPAPSAPSAPKRTRRKAAERTDAPTASEQQVPDPEDMTMEQPSWKATADRLKALGIRKYRLDSQIETQTFLFTCHFSPPDNPRVVRRFEAEAETPLEAVQKVLHQVDEWRGRNSGKIAEVLADDED